MRLLAHENIPGAAVAALEAAGDDVVWVKITAAGASDLDVLARAAREQRVLITLTRISAN